MTDPVGGSGGSRLTFGGLATGLDTNALVQTLIQIERRPLDRLEARRSEFTTQQGLLRDLNTKLLALRDAARTLDNRSSTLGAASTEEELLAFQVASSDESVVTATASGSASPGTYDVVVSNLATVGRQLSTTFSSQTDKVVTGGTLEISHAGDTNITIAVGAGGLSLNELRDAINASGDNDGNVRAEVLFDGTDYRLIISAAATGVENDVSILQEPTHTGLGSFIATTQAAEDASLDVLGITITRPSNTITDAIPGLTLQLRSESASTVTLESTLDSEAIAGEVQSLVDAYNDVVGFVERNTAFDAETRTSAPLSGDSTVSLIQSRLQGAVSAAYSFVDNSLRSVAEIGIRFGSDGRLTLDSDKLSEALAENPQAVREFLSGGDSADFGGTPILDGGEPVFGDGFATALSRALEPITRFGDGFLAQRISGIDSSISDLDDRIVRFEDILAQREERLRARFTALERLVASLQAQQSFLSGAIG